MTKPTQENIEDVAAKHRFLGTTIEQVYWMKNILKEMQKTPMGKEFALMGGSAIAFLYENIYRLSVDLDMDYIANADIGRKGSHELEVVQTEHFIIIEGIGKELGLKVRNTELTEDRRFAQFEMIYPSVYGGHKSVDLDLGYRYCHSILETNFIDFPDFIEGDAIKVQTLAPEELWASKITAAIGGVRMDAPDDKKDWQEERAREEILTLLEKEVARYVRGRWDEGKGLDNAVRQVIARERDPYSIVEEMVEFLVMGGQQKS